MFALVGLPPATGNLPALDPVPNRCPLPGSGPAITTTPTTTSTTARRQLWLVLPCALLVACGVVVPVAGGLLLAQTLYSDALMSWRQILAVVRHGSQPTELLAKRLAMVGGWVGG